MKRMTPEQLAQFFHETYERLAPKYKYETRKESAVPWSEVPDNNKKLMIAVAGEVLEHLSVAKEDVTPEQIAQSISDKL